MNNPINDTVFDSRDLIEYVEELKQELLSEYNEEKGSNNDDYEDIDDIDIIISDEEYNSVNKEEYIKVKEFADELESYCVDYKYGTTIIHENYWVEYCEELCKDIGYIPKDLPWYIANHIDWEGVSKEIAIDYTQVEYEGDNYYIR